MGLTPQEGGAWLTIHRVQVSVLLEAAVVLVLLAADVARVPEIVCEGWKDNTWSPGLQSRGVEFWGPAHPPQEPKKGQAQTGPN